MKKLALLLAVIFSTGIILSIQSFSVALPIRVVVNGTKINFPDAQPFVDSQSRTQTPARFIGEALGATASWDGTTRKATFVKGSKKLVIYIGKKEYEVDGQKKVMDTVALIKNSRTFVPARYVAEAFGATVKWNDAIKTVNIETAKEPVGDGKTETIGGFVLPAYPEYTKLFVSETDWGGVGEVMFEVNLLRTNVEKQIEDLTAALSQKCDKSTVDQVVSYIKQKKKRFDYLESKTIYDNGSKRYLWIMESEVDEINIVYCKAGAVFK